MSKKSFNIGDKFLSWEVIECVNPKKYRYLCRCSCGKEREFNKYNLLRGSYAPCKECGHAHLSNTALIRKHWNTELNGQHFTKAQDFNLSTSYWFICENGHNFKSTIKDFALHKCLSCKNEFKSNTPRMMLMEFATALFQKIYGEVRIEGFAVIVPKAKKSFYIIESDRFSNYRNYYKSEDDMVNDSVNIRKSQMDLIGLGYVTRTFNLSSKSFKKNVDSFTKFVIEWF